MIGDKDGEWVVDIPGDESVQERVVLPEEEGGSLQRPPGQQQHQHQCPRQVARSHQAQRLRAFHMSSGWCGIEFCPGWDGVA